MDYFIGGLIGLAVGVFGVSTAEYILKYNLVDLIIEFFKNKVLALFGKKPLK